MNYPTSAIAIHGDARRAELLAHAERVYPLIIRSQPRRRTPWRVGLLRRTAGTVLVRAGLHLSGAPVTPLSPIGPSASME